MLNFHEDSRRLWAVNLGGKCRATLRNLPGAIFCRVRFYWKAPLTVRLYKAVPADAGILAVRRLFLLRRSPSPGLCRLRCLAAPGVVSCSRVHPNSSCKNMLPYHKDYLHLVSGTDHGGIHYNAGYDLHLLVLSVHTTVPAVAILEWQ